MYVAAYASATLLDVFRFYCEPCEQCICVLCALHEHNEHDVSSLADGLERHRATFDGLLDNCKTRIDAVRQQLTLADAFKSSLSAAEDCIRHAAIDAIAAVRQRERELLEGLRSFVGDDALSFLGKRDALGDRLAELDNACETMDTMIGRTSVELLITKKEVHERLRAALDGQQIRTPDKVRLGGVHYVAGDEPFRDLRRPTSDIGQLFRSVADDDRGDRAAEDHATDESSSSSSMSSTTSSGSEESDSDEERRSSETVRFVCQLPPLEHMDLVARSQDESETDDSDSDDEEDNKEDENVEEPAPVTKICISDGVVRRVVIKSQSFCDAAKKPSPPPRPSGRKIPDFSRTKPAATYANCGTEMERVETTDAATTMPRVVFCDKETYTGYVYLVHKNVSTDNQGTADKGTSITTDVTAAYRSVSNGGRSAAITRGTNTMTASMSDRASSPVAALRSPPTAPTSTPVTKVPAYPIHQRPGTAQAPSTTQKSTTSDAASVTAPTILPIAGKVPADAQKESGAANMAPYAPQTTLSTAPTASAQPVSATAATRQATSAVSPTAQAVQTSSKLPATFQKPVTSSSVVSPAAATAPSQSVTSPPHPMTSSVVAVSTQSQQKLTTISPGSVTLATATAVSPTTTINLPSVAAAGSNQPSTVSSTAVQKPIMSSNSMLSKALSSSYASVTAQTVATASSSQVTSPMTQISNATQQRPSSTALTSSVPQKTSPQTSQSGIDAMVTSPTAHKLMTSALSQSLATNVPPQTAASTDSSPSANNNRVQTVSSKASVVTSPVTPTNKQVAPPVTSTLTASTAASMQTSMMQEQSSWSRQSQPSLSKHPTPVLPSQSASVTAPAAHTVATAPSSQITSPVTQISNVTQQRPSNIAPTSSVPQKTSPQTLQSGIDNVATSPTAQKLMTSALSQSQTSSKTPAASVTSSASLQTQLQMSSSSAPTTNTLSNPIVPTTSQKPTSFVLPTTQPQSPAAITTTVVTASENVMRQSATANNHVLNATTSVPPVLTTTQKSMTATAPSPTQLTAPMAAQKPVTSPTSSTMQSQHPATAKSMVLQGMSINPVSNVATSVPVVTTTAQKLLALNNGQMEDAASLTSPSSPSSAAVTENSAAAAITNVQTPASPLTSPASRQRGVFRSFSTENVRSPAPVLRPPPPIMTTSVAAVTQRLNGGAANGSGKNNWRPNSNR